MPLPLEDHVRQTLLENDRGAKLYNAAMDGWQAFKELYPNRHRWRRKSASRHMVWEEVVQRLAEVAANDDDIHFVEHQDTVSMVIEGEVLFRLKHADMALVTHNYPTAEAQKYDDHEIDDLFGFSGVQRVKLCYVPDQYMEELVWVGIAAYDQGKLIWRIELQDSGIVKPVAELPLQQPDTNTERLAKLKNPETDAGQKKKNKKDNG